MQKIHRKLEKVRASLQKMIEEYCMSLEKTIADKVKTHKVQSSPYIAISSVITAGSEE